MNKCPEALSLRELLADTRVDATHTQIVNHVEACGRCQQTLAEMTQTDTRLESVSRTKSIPQFIQRMSRELPLDDQTEATAAEDDTWQHFLSPPRTPNELGRLGNYAIIGELGRGGMGIVLEARDEDLQRDVAIKIIRPSLQKRVGYQERFVREARTMAAIDHPHVVPIYAVEHCDDLPIVVMKLLQGQTLADRIAQSGPLAQKQLASFSLQAAVGLQALHDAGCIHRDIKPSNLFLESCNENVRLLDLGLARRDDDTEMTQTGAVMGTPSYMSPEQARGEKVDAKSDRFSLGAVLYFAATGKPPFDGPNPMAILLSLANSSPVPLQKVAPGIDRRLADEIMHLLHKQRDQRTDDLRSLQASIEQTSDGSRSKRWLKMVVAGPLLFLALFAITMTIQTPHGEVVIELAEGVDPETVRVALSTDGDIVVTDAGEDFRVHLAQGKYDAELLSNDTRLVLTHNTVTVKKNSVETIRIKWKPNARVSDTDQLLTKREILNWVFDVGGRVRLHDSPAKEITAPARLPSNISRVLAIDLLGCEIQDDDLLRLDGLDALSRLDIGNERSDTATDRATQRQSTKLTADAFVKLAEMQIPRLTELHSIGVPVRAKGLQELSRVRSLASIQLNDGKLTDDDLRHLSASQRLRSLALFECGVTGAGLSHLASSQIETLIFADRRMDSSAIAQMPPWRTLEFLSLNGMLQQTISEAALQSLDRYDNLETLRLTQFKNRSSESLIPITAIDNLRSLRIVNVHAIDENLVRQIAIDLDKLESLDLRNTSLSDALVSELVTISTLRSLDVSGNPRLSTMAIQRLRQGLPSAQVVAQTK